MTDNTSDSEDCSHEEEQRYINVNVREPKVTVRDDQGDLQEMEEMTSRLLEQAVEAHHDLAEEAPNGGFN